MLAFDTGDLDERMKFIHRAIRSRWVFGAVSDTGQEEVFACIFWVDELGDGASESLCFEEESSDGVRAHFGEAFEKDALRCDGGKWFGKNYLMSTLFMAAGGGDD